MPYQTATNSVDSKGVIVMQQNEHLAVAILCGGRSFAEAAEMSGLPVNLILELWKRKTAVTCEAKG